MEIGRRGRPDKWGWSTGMRGPERERRPSLMGNRSTHLFIFLLYSMDIDQTPRGFNAYVTNEGRIRYDKPMKVISICNLDIFYFPFDEQNCTFSFSSFLYTGE